MALAGPRTGSPPMTKVLALLLLLPASAPSPFTVLVFTKTAGFVHESIPAGVAAVKSLGERSGFTVESTADASAFTDDNLKRFKVVMFLSTTGDVLDEKQQAAFERYVRGGGG